MMGIRDFGLLAGCLFVLSACGGGVYIEACGDPNNGACWIDEDDLADQKAAAAPTLRPGTYSPSFATSGLQQASWQTPSSQPPAPPAVRKPSVERAPLRASSLEEVTPPRPEGFSLKDAVLRLIRTARGSADDFKQFIARGVVGEGENGSDWRITVEKVR